MQDTREDLDTWRAAALEQWTDSRIVDAAWVDTHLWFFQHLYADLAQFSLGLRGYSFREKYGEWLLVLRLLQDSIPQVVFVSSKTPTGCMSKLRRMLRSEGIELREDRYG